MTVTQEAGRLPDDPCVVPTDSLIESSFRGFVRLLTDLSALTPTHAPARPSRAGDPLAVADADGRREGVVGDPGSRSGAPSDHPSQGGALGDRLADAPPSGELTRLLEGLDPSLLTTDGLVEAIAGWERLIAWSQANQASLVAAYSAQSDSTRHERQVADHLAARLTLTTRAAESKVAFASYLRTCPKVHDLLAAGRIDSRKVVVLEHACALLPEAVEQDVLTQVLSDAPDLTAPALRARARRIALDADPAGAQRRAEAAAAERRVDLTPAPDTMAWFGAYLPADHAAVCFSAVDAIAAATAADDRTIDQRRADALTDVLRQVLDAGATPGGLPVPTQQHRRPHIQVTVAASTLAGLDDSSAELAGYGPIPAATARRIAQDGTWRRVLLDARTGEVIRQDPTAYRPGADLTGTVLARDVTCTFPGCRVPAWRCDLDHITPFDPASRGAEQTTADNLHALCRRHHRLKTHSAWTVARDPDTGITTWTSPTGTAFARPPSRPPGAIANRSGPTTGPAGRDHRGDPAGTGSRPPSVPQVSDPPPF